MTPVYSPEEALGNDLTKASGMVETKTEDIGSVTYLKTAVAMSDTPGSVRFRAPYAGEHNGSVLTHLGYSAEQIRQLKEDGVI